MKKTTDLSPLLRYLRDHTYANLPSELFDRYLWFYNSVEELQHRWIYGKRSRRFVTFVRSEGELVSAAAMAIPRQRHVQMLFSGSSAAGIEEMVSDALHSFRRRKCNIEIGDHMLACEVAQRFSAETRPGAIKLYATIPVNSIAGDIVEMTLEHEHLLTSMEQRRWPGFKHFIDRGYEFFGKVENGKLLSMCGLAGLTAHTCQIIGVETFEDQQKRHGHAKDVCGYAMEKGLQSARLVTWSTSIQNHASVQTAMSLGFTPYSRTYHIEA